MIPGKHIFNNGIVYIPNDEKQRYHREGLSQAIANLNEILKPDLILVDALNGDPEFEEGGNPFTLNLFMAAFDPVLLDSYACSLLGLKPSDVPYIHKAAALGVGCETVSSETLVALNKGKGLDNLQRSSLADELLDHICEKGACSACFASLIQALKLLQKQGVSLPGKLYIGQGLKEKNLQRSGVGDCLANASSFVAGCPPKSSEIFDYLKKK